MALLKGLRLRGPASAEFGVENPKPSTKHKGSGIRFLGAAVKKS